MTQYRIIHHLKECVIVHDSMNQDTLVGNHCVVSLENMENTKGVVKCMNDSTHNGPSMSPQLSENTIYYNITPPMCFDGFYYQYIGLINNGTEILWQCENCHRIKIARIPNP